MGRPRSAVDCARAIMDKPAAAKGRFAAGTAGLLWRFAWEAPRKRTIRISWRRKLSPPRRKTDHAKNRMRHDLVKNRLNAKRSPALSRKDSPLVRFFHLFVNDTVNHLLHFGRGIDRDDFYVLMAFAIDPEDFISKRLPDC